MYGKILEPVQKITKKKKVGGYRKRTIYIIDSHMLNFHLEYGFAKKYS